MTTDPLTLLAEIEAALEPMAAYVAEFDKDYRGKEVDWSMSADGCFYDSSPRLSDCRRAAAAREAVAKIRNEYEGIIAMLKEMEWMEWVGLVKSYCPSCGNFKGAASEYSAHCKLKAAIDGRLGSAGAGKGE